VVPKDVLINVVIAEEPLKHSAQYASCRNVTIKSARTIRWQNMDARLALARVEPHRSVIENRFFNEEHSAIRCGALQQMLWPLINPVPAEVRKANQIGL